MPNRIDMDKVDQAFRDAARKSVAETFAQGRPVAGVVNGISGLCYPDGRFEPFPAAGRHGVGVDEADPNPIA